MNTKMKIILPIVVIVVVSAFILFRSGDDEATISLEEKDNGKILTENGGQTITKESESFDEEIDEIINSILSEDTELNEDDNVVLAEFDTSDLDGIYDKAVSIE